MAQVIMFPCFRHRSCQQAWAHLPDDSVIQGTFQDCQVPDIGADVNRKSVKCNTALHDCAESGSLEIMKLLIISGARIDVDAYGMTPRLAASVTSIQLKHKIGQGSFHGFN